MILEEWISGEISSRCHVLSNSNILLRVKFLTVFLRKSLHFGSWKQIFLFTQRKSDIQENMFTAFCVSFGSKVTLCEENLHFKPFNTWVERKRAAASNECCPWCWTGIQFWTVSRCDLYKKLCSSTHKNVLVYLYKYMLPLLQCFNKCDALETLILFPEEFLSKDSVAWVSQTKGDIAQN